MQKKSHWRSITKALIAQDADLERIVQRFGFAPDFCRPPGFASLVQIILEQQVSLASARATFVRLEKVLCGCVMPVGVLDLSDQQLKDCGFSRQKTRYARELANAIVCKKLDLDSLEQKDDDEVRERLMDIKGIGIWSANIYLMMCLQRQDVWPEGDIALEEAIKQIKGLESRPKGEDFLAWGERWRPYRSAAAFLLWHYYLCV